MRLPGPPGGPTASGSTPWSHTRTGDVRASSETLLPFLSIREKLQPTLSISEVTGGAGSGDSERGRCLLFQLTSSCGVPATCQGLSQGLAGKQSQSRVAPAPSPLRSSREDRPTQRPA